MGMSASQARYLNLAGRLNDLEFQGQQINQSRTTLSDQTNNLYTQLQNLDVPTPPVTNDYTTIVYSTVDGAMNYTLGMVRPSNKGDGLYNIDLKYSTVGDSLHTSNVSSSITYSDSKINVREILPTTITTKTGDYIDASVEGVEPEFYISNSAQRYDGSDLRGSANASEYVKIDPTSGGYVAVTGEFEAGQIYVRKTSVEAYNQLEDSEKAEYNGYIEETKTKTNDIVIDASELSSYYVQIGNSKPVALSDVPECYVVNNNKINIKLPEGYRLFAEGGNKTIDNPNPNQLKIGGNQAYTYSEAYTEFGDKINWSSYEKAIVNSFGGVDNENNAKLDDFYYVITPNKSGTYDVSLYKIEDIPATETQGASAKGYTYETGTYTKSDNMDYVELKFDSTGRISKISIPTGYDEKGIPTGYKELEVTAKSETDNLAYENAMTQYEYAKFQYDKEQTKINAEMSLIQSQDKKLELKLQRLDTERTQITTEIESLKKVINDDIESSYKTFSG